MNLASVLLALVTGCYMAEGCCPPGFIQGLNNGDCYRYRENSRNWYEAEEDCVQRGGHLASVQSGFENAFLSESWNFGNSAYWLGGSYGITDNKWTWTDGRPFGYTNWATSKPAQSGSQQCLGINLRTGLWASYDCGSRMPFICKVIAGSPEPPPTVAATACPVVSTSCPSAPPAPAEPCPAGWTFLALTNKCYMMTAAAYDGNDAAAVCLKNNASLTSIHSYAENAFLTSIIQPNVVWIGLYSDNTWKWADGTPLNYTHWLSGYPDDRGACVYLDGRSKGPDESFWANWFGCASTYNALCSMTALG